jgi:uncharacterized BrkB/YihY/UPF0761 family membrane protein
MEIVTAIETPPRFGWWKHLRPTLHYWTETEVHVYSFSVAANVLLSFFPFLIVLTSLVRFGLNWFGVERGIYVALHDYFPGETGDFLVRNLQSAVYRNGNALSAVSMLLLLFTANGIFMPLEVALNRVWGITENRSFVKNQVISQVLVFGCGILWFISTAAAAPVAQIGWLSAIVYKIASLPITIGIVFLTYWLLPNAKVPKILILLAAIAVGLAIELTKVVNLLIWPWLYGKLSHEYGPFVNSITILTWAFVFSMLFLAGAEWSARKARELGVKAGSVNEA